MHLNGGYTFIVCICPIPFIFNHRMVLAGVATYSQLCPDAGSHWLLARCLTSNQASLAFLMKSASWG